MRPRRSSILVWRGRSGFRNGKSSSALALVAGLNPTSARHRAVGMTERFHTAILTTCLPGTFVVVCFLAGSL
jgi:hypothetical protein